MFWPYSVFLSMKHASSRASVTIVLWLSVVAAAFRSIHCEVKLDADANTILPCTKIN
jgi:hypothetical protein